MNHPLTRYRSAQWSLVLVMLVIFLCSGQRAGLLMACPFKAVAAEHSADSYPSQQLQRQDGQSSDVLPSCDLTDHLLQIHQQSLGHALIYTVTLLLLLPLLIGSPFRVPQLTEPIPTRRRRHLILCVFRE
ncbi:hypothetical protein [Photobacterium sp. TY1-4]|uniref:hypothetical protein n=1 Tax=Photobacterium sp. TY1-4 TaxID=2899122 RepID=UPI0021BE3700|nr:hypothetical protein [Photobacterium sp. TY1-4]UXI04377.1 hypothetical protein NH461_20020 [Photobacterium sp. TY1-4]